MRGGAAPGSETVRSSQAQVPVSTAEMHLAGHWDAEPAGGRDAELEEGAEGQRP